MRILEKNMRVNLLKRKEECAKMIFKAQKRKEKEKTG
jgi:hypothetical protein